MITRSRFLLAIGHIRASLLCASTTVGRHGLTPSRYATTVHRTIPSALTCYGAWPQLRRYGSTTGPSQPQPRHTSPTTSAHVTADVEEESPLPASPSAVLPSRPLLLQLKHFCPTAAVLVDTDGSACVTAPYCAEHVGPIVRDRLRSLLVERLVAPLLSQDVSVDPSLSSDSTAAESAAEVLAEATLAVHDAVESIRFVAFSTMSPALQHRSWQPLWEAYRQYLLDHSQGQDQFVSAENVNTAAHASLPSAMPSSASAEARDEACSRAVRVSETDVSLRGREAAPLFGPVVRNSAFFYLSPATLTAGHPPPLSRSLHEAFPSPSSARASALAPQQTRKQPPAPDSLFEPLHNTEPNNTLPSPHTSAAPEAGGGVWWECFRVDVFMPSHVQLVVAVRHLLTHRRPPFDLLSVLTAQGGRAVPASPWWQAETILQPLTVIAVVVPESLEDRCTAALRALEQERQTAVRERETQGSRVEKVGGSVELLLFNSTQLVHAFSAV